MTTTLHDDPLLRDVPEIDGWKVLAPAVLYAKIGQGGMGAVYRGQHLELEIDVAVKILKPSLVAEDEQFEQRFRREARFAAELTHENLVRLYDLRRAHGLSYLILEFVEGETARDRVARKGPLREEEAAQILLGVARGLAKAHRHHVVIVHRDIKPENLLVSKRGEVKLADLGIAKALDREEDATFTTQGVIGTPTYMAPEQWEDTKLVGPHTDVWALGATLYFLLTGANAIRSGTQQQVGREICDRPSPDVYVKRPDLSAPLFKILDRCVQKDPAQRYADAGLLARDLEEFLSGRAPSLLDKDTGSVRAQADVVSPPPAHALKKIRIATLGTREKTAASMTQPPGRTERITSITSLADGGASAPQRKWAWFGGSIVLAAACVVTAMILNERPPMDAESKAPATAGKPADEKGASPKQPAQIEPEKTATAPVPSPSTPEPTAVVFDPPLKDGRYYTREPASVLRGRVSNAGVTSLKIKRNGRATGEKVVHEDGRFELDLNLARDNSETIELATGDGRRFTFEVVQDSTPPKIDIQDPAPSAQRTKQNHIDVRLSVDDANLARVEIGSTPLEKDGAGTWSTSNVAVPIEGKNDLAILAEDWAGNRTATTLVIVRDTAAPKRIIVEPPEDTELDVGTEVTLELSFDEPLAGATLEGQPMIVADKAASLKLFGPYGDGAFSWSWQATDLAGNLASGTVSFTRRSRPNPPVPISWWEVLEEKVDVRIVANPELRTAIEGTDLPWRVRDRASGIEMLLVPAGRYLRGLSEGDKQGGKNEMPAHQVRITMPFYLSRYEVQETEWNHVLDGAQSELSLGLPKGNVSRDDILGFLQRCPGLRLPTEGEWEYACRAGITSPLYGPLDDIAWHAGNSGLAIHSVGGRRANALGFHDTIGNLWEWCVDNFDSAEYARCVPSIDNPVGPERGETNVLRGGSWNNDIRMCRASYRFGERPADRYIRYGFRVSRTP